MRKLYFKYKEQELCLAELEALFGVPREAIRARIKSGWSVEAAAETPITTPSPIEAKWIGKVLEIKFLRPIPQVFRSMQPNLATTYIAYPHQNPGQRQKAKLFFTIRLENGLPLIVYPEDFHIIGEAVLPAEKDHIAT